MQIQENVNFPRFALPRNSMKKNVSIVSLNSTLLANCTNSTNSTNCTSNTTDTDDDEDNLNPEPPLENSVVSLNSTSCPYLPEISGVVATISVVSNMT